MKKSFLYVALLFPSAAAFAQSPALQASAQLKSSTCEISIAHGSETAYEFINIVPNKYGQETFSYQELGFDFSFHTSPKHGVLLFINNKEEDLWVTTEDASYLQISAKNWAYTFRLSLKDLDLSMHCIKKY